ncbi:alpha/beta-hydrolase [Conidiobolus coronatus NRRL 28638]|uniref:Alpha/beta-hydrolase n=1 Tax=Conidiobolus coronatus (strain ATCC 28846 / CBS 209.66 / NRRL 28638) TaxID=796925 RepID=A0A137NS21_CONC2|nr:alpha/beta-hydrolase [Conidiobolus coronatus NRRL 28638]|eukprot:KXN65555.1 alpha/beta-hydrolase [Conidiobolus coronatus NRRL 28638]
MALGYASVAYCPLDTVVNWKCNTCDGSTRGTSDVVLFNNDVSETYAYLAVNHYHKIIVISFRGTDGLGDWMGNLKVSMTSLNLPPPYQDAKVHRGFNTFVEGIVDELRYALSNALRMNPSYTVKFVGHSKGGALASIAAVKMVQYRVVTWNKVSIFTYGQPRTGNAEFANYINSQPVTVLRVTAHADMVTVVPKLIHSYQHYQYNLHMTSDGKTVLCDIFGEDPDCTNDFWVASLDAHYTYFNLRINSACT